MAWFTYFDSSVGCRTTLLDLRSTSGRLGAPPRTARATCQQHDVIRLRGRDCGAASVASTTAATRRLFVTRQPLRHRLVPEVAPRVRSS